MQDNPTTRSPRRSGLASKFLYHPLSRILIEATVLFGSLFILKTTLIKPGLEWLGLQGGLFKGLQGLATIVFMFVIYVLMMRLYERRKLTELTLDRLVPEGLAGTLLATGMVSLVFATLWLAGAWYVVSTGSFAAMLVPFIWVVVMASLEELIFRGILYRNLEQWLGTVSALLLSAGIFGVMHITNDHANFVTVIAAGSGGLMMGAIYSLTGRLWIPIFFHIFWNFTQAILGSVVSGAEIFGTYLESVRKGPVWLTGGDFGIEHSVVTLGLTFAVIGVLLVLMKRRGLFLKRGQYLADSD